MAWGCVLWSIAASVGKKRLAGGWGRAVWCWRGGGGGAGMRTTGASGAEMPTRWISGWAGRLWRKPWTWPWTRPTMATRMGGAVWAAALFGVRLDTRRPEARRSLARLIGLGTSVTRLGWAEMGGSGRAFARCPP